MTISKNIFQFLHEIKNNNRREWFLKNKDRYQAIRKELTTFAEAWFDELTVFDEALRSPEEKPYIFRIYRDARFAKGKIYKTHFGIMIHKGGRPAMHSRAGYYLHLEPGKSFLAGGCYLPPPEWLQNIRNDIAREAKKIKTVLNESYFKKYFTLEGEKVKTSPKGFTKDHPEIELLRHKSFIAVHSLSDEQVMGKDFLNHLSKASKALYPFDEYLNKRLP